MRVVRKAVHKFKISRVLKHPIPKEMIDDVNIVLFEIFCIF